ncbi:hypothetical protein [Pseudoxanthomonas sp. PXM02]|uniref:hypothetical protein n=1 Tax=Pseudoxanthomonas sp. PXM02 TaxID=2769294 RepID=UPI00177BB373|nr:hypothetical protein [Pseudoxanthomonas sp. PXM02]MBD9478975.1 hypothetical protein [Pseudoxanthomonas sp. PXM02]
MTDIAHRRSMRGTRSTDNDATRDRAIAVTVSAAIVASFALVLLQEPVFDPAVPAENRLRLRFLSRSTPADIPRAHDVSTEASPSSRSASPHLPVASSASSPATSPTVTASDRPTLYAKDGRLLLPPGAADTAAPARRPPGMAGGDDGTAARGPFDRPNPIDYRETRFDKHWRNKGTAGDAMLENAHGTVSGMAAVIPLGTGDQPARARPPPEVRFNPARHERLADLGSEATGDAYKAAPISSEPPPDLKGGASRRIRDQLAAIRQDFGHCRATLLDDLVAPILRHLAELERVEYALAHGADPVRAEHLLPREADTAYNLARRAAWHARMKLGTCR